MKLLKPHETEELIAKAQAGDMVARNRLVMANLGLISYVLRKYEAHSGLPYSDLQQEGVIGLIRAIELYKPAASASFSTYACMWIRQAINRAIESKGRLLRRPHHIEHCATALKRLGASVDSKTPEQIAELVDFTPAQIKSTLDSRAGVSLTDDLSKLSCSEKEYEEIEYTEQKALVHELMGSLTEKQRRVVELRLGFSGCDTHSWEAIGERLGFSRSTAVNHFKEAIAALQEDERVASLR